MQKPQEAEIKAISAFFLLFIISIGQAEEGILYDNSEANVQTFSVPEWPRYAPSDDDHCIAIAIHHESRGEGLKGQRSVLDVIQNRMLEAGESACKVIKKPKQFSFVTKRTKWKASGKQMELFNKVKNHPKVLANNYLWFYNKVIASPTWASKMKCKRIAKHHFCKKN